MDILSINSIKATDFVSKKSGFQNTKLSSSSDSQESDTLLKRYKEIQERIQKQMEVIKIKLAKATRESERTQLQEQLSNLNAQLISITGKIMEYLQKKAASL